MMVHCDLPCGVLTRNSLFFYMVCEGFVAFGLCGSWLLRSLYLYLYLFNYHSGKISSISEVNPMYYGNTKMKHWSPTSGFDHFEVGFWSDFGHFKVWVWLRFVYFEVRCY